MADNKKYLWKAYGAAFLGLVLGLVVCTAFIWNIRSAEL